MRCNSDLVLRGAKAVLVPYRPEHVEVYHQWMTDPSLQEATASESLSLEEEYSMQKSWAEDEDKCTFIVLDPASEDSASVGQQRGGMAGDTNLFLNQWEEKGTAEVEVMIAEKGSRGKGLGKEATSMMMAYGASDLGIRRFVVKIGEDNAASLKMFQGLGFVEVSRSSVFREVTLELIVDGERKLWLEATSAAMSRAQYDNNEGV